MWRGKEYTQLKYLAAQLAPVELKSKRALQHFKTPHEGTEGTEAAWHVRKALGLKWAWGVDVHSEIANVQELSSH